ncbi:MAG: hypothetical protein J7K87_04005 [Candidatus Aenigmarchaeota archaeon]|nr:hypothetical protein [Candidatus Aenigmarchaeota archaeon]
MNYVKIVKDISAVLETDMNNIVPSIKKLKETIQKQEEEIKTLKEKLK